MSFVKRLLVLLVVLTLCSLMPTTFARSYSHRQRTSRKYDRGEEEQLLELLEDIEEDRAEEDSMLITRHDDEAETRWRPVFDSDVNGEIIEPTDREDAGLTDAQRTLMVDEHNKLRKAEGATNMEKLKWNEKLAKLARIWADGCVYKHGKPPSNADDTGFRAIGQNNWIGKAVDVKTVVQNWYEEKQYFDYNSLQCTSGKSCDRYKQLVWSSTTDIGCAVKQCASVGGMSNAQFVVCYYGPAGNWMKEKPYLKGQLPCSQCGRGQFYCNNGLCDSTCKAAGSGCECKAACKNCGTTTSDCKCQCKDGSSGADCSQKCMDFDKRCGRREAGWPAVMCRPTFQFVVKACPKMCGKCKVGNPCGRDSDKYEISGDDDRDSDE